jgi:hypothetical protein
MSGDELELGERMRRIWRSIWPIAAQFTDTGEPWTQLSDMPRPFLFVAGCSDALAVCKAAKFARQQAVQNETPNEPASAIHFH